MLNIAAISLFLVLLTSIGLGFLKDSWFLQFGLAIVVVSSVTSIVLAFMGWRKAAQAEQVDFESYLPSIDTSRSHSFRYTGGIMGVDTNNPVKYLQDQINEVRSVTNQDAETFSKGLLFNEARIDSCLAQIRYHEEVTLPKMLGQGSGSIMLAGALTIVGSAYLAFPDDLHKKFAVVADFLRTLI